MDPKAFVSEFTKSVTPGLDKSIAWYRGAAETEKISFDRKSALTRGLGLLASTIIFVSTLRLDQLLMEALGVEKAVSGKIGTVFGATGLLVAFFAYWFGRGLTERGHLKGWIRYALTAQKLEELKAELELAAPKLEAMTALGVAPDLKDLTDSLFGVAERIRAVPTQESEQWAKDAMSDLTTYVQSARDAAKAAESANGGGGKGG